MRRRRGGGWGEGDGRREVAKAPVVLDGGGVRRPSCAPEPSQGAGVAPLQGTRHALAEEGRPQGAQAISVVLEDAGGLALDEVVKLIAEATVGIHGGDKKVGADEVEVLDGALVVPYLFRLSHPHGRAIGIFGGVDGVGRNYNEVTHAPAVAGSRVLPGHVEPGGDIVGVGGDRTELRDVGEAGLGGVGCTAKDAVWRRAADLRVEAGSEGRCLLAGPLCLAVEVTKVGVPAGRVVRLFYFNLIDAAVCGIRVHKGDDDDWTKLVGRSWREWPGYYGPGSREIRMSDIGYR